MKSYFSWFMAVLWTSSWLINETEKYHHAIIVLYILTLVDIPACCVARTLSSNIFVLVCIKINVFLSLNVLDMTPHPKYNVIFLHQHHILFEKIIILFEKQYIGWVGLQIFFKNMPSIDWFVLEVLHSIKSHLYRFMKKLNCFCD